MIRFRFPRSPVAGTGVSTALLAALLVCCCLMAAPAEAQQAEDADALLGSAIEAAKAGDLVGAEAILRDASGRFPQDPRFPTERAGVAYLQGDPSAAKRWLHLARKLGSGDPYVAEFLGTLYLLEGNPEAALVLWNPIGKPRLSDSQTGTGLEQVIAPELAGIDIPFPAGSTLPYGGYLRASRVTALLGVCGVAPVELEAAEDERYLAALRCVEKPAFGATLPSTALMLARGLGYQAVHLHHPNLGRRAVSLQTMLRWDARKRRAWAAMAMPIAGRAAWRFEVYGDARHEYWRMLSPEDHSEQQAFLHRRVEGGVAVSAVLGSRTLWQNRLSLSNRSFPVVSSLPAGADRLDTGSSIRYGHRVQTDILRLPIQRIFVSAAGEASIERYGGLGRTVGREELSLRTIWYPGASSRSGNLSLRVSGGAAQGRLPLTELFAAGVERDGAIPMRAHVGTRDGRKGSALYGDRYLAANLEAEKTLLHAGLWTLSVAPFLDAGWMRDPGGKYGARKTRFDAGIQLVAATAGGTELRVSYGWDLRQRRSAIYAWSEPFP